MIRIFQDFCKNNRVFRPSGKLPRGRRFTRRFKP
jgi:hypothetical protein